MSLLTLLVTLNARAASPSVEILWSVRMGEERVMLTKLRADGLDAYRLAYLVGDRARAAQVIPDQAARAQTRELKDTLPARAREVLAAPLDRCRSPLAFAMGPAPAEALCLDRIDRARGERLSRWWLRARALLGI